MSEQELAERIEALESRLVFQDDTIESLNKTVADLNEEVQILKAQLRLMAEKAQSEGSQLADPNQVEIPPHY